jgi:hypothetical protein
MFPSVDLLIPFLTVQMVWLAVVPAKKPEFGSVEVLEQD